MTYFQEENSSKRCFPKKISINGHINKKFLLQGILVTCSRKIRKNFGQLSPKNETEGHFILKSSHFPQKMP